MKLPRTCRQCGRTFLGGPRAWYCPECRKERQAAQQQAYQARKRRGQVRELGSTDICALCGGEYQVASSHQRYCPACAPAALAESDRRHSLGYYHCNKERINSLRNIKRRLTVRRCAMCQREFAPAGKEHYCSDACRNNARRMVQIKADAKRMGKPQPEILPPPRWIDWSDVDWSLSNREIADLKKCSPQSVWAARKRLKK